MAKLLGLATKFPFTLGTSPEAHDDHATSVTSKQEVSSCGSSDRTPQTTAPSSLASPFDSLYSHTQSPAIYSRSPALNASKTNLSIRPKTAGEVLSPPKGSKDWIETRMAMGSPIEIATDKDVFRFPTPVRRPSTANSLQNTGPTEVPIQESVIGMALGSPSQQPPYFPAMQAAPKATDNEEVVDQIPRPVRAHTTKELRNDIMDGSKPKLSRWKSLGGFFGRRRPAQMNYVQSSNFGSKNTLGMEQGANSPQQVADIGFTTTISATTPDHRSGSPGLFRRVTKKGVRVRSPSTRARNEPSPPPKDEPEDAPQLDIDIPESRMERYSVLFKEVAVLPTRSSSLLARRQASGDGSRPLPGGSMRALDIPSGRLARRATEPSPRDSPSYKLFPSGSNRSTTERLPHISTLHRPRPIKRNNSAPPSLPTPNPYEHQKLSPTFEADELAFDDENRLTPTPSTPASPSTPKSLAPDPVQENVKPIRLSMRKNSWDTTTSKSVADPNWEMITVGKRLSPADLLSRVKAVEVDTQSLDDVEDVIEEAPQVGIARSLSVTKAVSRQKLHMRPTRVSSKRVAKGDVKLVHTSSVKRRVPNATAFPVPQIDMDKPIPRSGSRRQELQLNLTNEIWGERGLAGLDQHMHENKTSTPRLCVVGEPESRKSVWGVIESA